MFCIYLFLLSNIVFSFCCASEQEDLLQEGPFAQRPHWLFVVEKGAYNPNMCRWTDFDSATIGALSCVNKKVKKEISDARDIILNKAENKKRFISGGAYKNKMVFNNEGQWCVVGTVRNEARHASIVFFGEASTFYAHKYDHQWGWFGGCIVSPMTLSTDTPIFALTIAGSWSSHSGSNCVFAAVPGQKTCWYMDCGSTIATTTATTTFNISDSNYVLFNFKKTIQRILEIPTWVTNNCVPIEDDLLQYDKVKGKKPCNIVCLDGWEDPQAIFFKIDLTSPLLPKEWWANVCAFLHKDTPREKLERIAEEEGLHKKVIERRIESCVQYQEHRLKKAKLENKMERWISKNNSSWYDKKTYQSKVFEKFTDVFESIEKKVGVHPEDVWESYHKAKPDVTMPLIRVHCSTWQEKIYAMLASFGGYNIQFPPIKYSLWACGENVPFPIGYGLLPLGLFMSLTPLKQYSLPFCMALLTRINEEKLCSNRIHYALYTGCTMAGIYGLGLWYGFGLMDRLFQASMPFFLTLCDVGMKMSKIRDDQGIVVPLMELWKSWPLRNYRALKDSERLQKSVSLPTHQ